MLGVFGVASVLAAAITISSVSAQSLLTCENSLANGLNVSAQPAWSTLFRADYFFQYPDTFAGDRSQWIFALCNTTRKTPRASSSCGATGGDNSGFFWAGEWTSGSSGTAACLNVYTRLVLAQSSSASVVRNPTASAVTFAFQTTDGSKTLFIAGVCDATALTVSPQVPETLSATERRMTILSSTFCPTTTTTTTSSPTGSGRNNNEIPVGAIVGIVVGAVLVIVGVVVIVVFVRRRADKERMPGDSTA
jgi:hypothetical protein